MLDLEYNDTVTRTQREVVLKNRTDMTIGLRCVGSVMFDTTGQIHDRQAKSPPVHLSVQDSSGIGNGEGRTDVSGNIITD